MNGRTMSGEPEVVPATKDPRVVDATPGPEASGGLAPEAPQPHSTRPAPSPEGVVMDMRELKALEIAARSKIVFDGGVWLVPSQTSPGTRYSIKLGDTPSCQCEDF